MQTTPSGRQRPPSGRFSGLPVRLATALAASALLVAACGSGEGDVVTADDQAVASDDETTVADNPAAADETEAEADDDPAGEDTDGASAVVAPVPASLASSYLGSYSLTDNGFGTEVTVTVDGSTRTIETNALPDHETGDFPNGGNPNAISAQELSWEFPTAAVYTGAATDVRTSGVAVNGIKFEPGTAETVACESGENYRIEALQDVFDLGLDFNNAHVQPTGEYHYHGISELLVGAYESDNDLVHIGFAADGHLMYYSKSGAYRSGYSLSDEARSGTGCVASGPAGNEIAIDGSAPDGTYTSDWVFSDRTGDLDACNGTTVDDRYVYIVTDTFPFVSRCLNGEVSGERVGGGGGQGPNQGQGGGRRGAGGEQQPGLGQGPTGGGGADLTDAAAALGVTVEELQQILGPPPADLEAVADELGVSVEELESVLPMP